MLQPRQLKLVAIVLGLLVAVFVCISIYNSAAPATLTISTDLDDVEAKVDGVATKFDETVSLQVSPGSHSLVITKSGFKPYRETVSAPFHGTLSRDITLEELPIKQQIADAAGSIDSILGAGKFSISEVRNFEHDTWVVATVVSLSVQTDPAIVVLAKRDDSLALVAGPGTSFEDADLVGFPTTVRNYLRSKGYAQ